MKNHKEYIPEVKNLFKSYLGNTINKDDLLLELIDIEYKVKKKYKYPKNKCLWLRFHKQDTLASTIYNICEGLDNATNKEYYNECLELACDDTNNDVCLYFS
jgi:hypothetical protein